MRKGTCLLFVLALSFSLAQAQPKYTVQDLGTLGGTYAGCGHGLNIKTQIAGGSSLPGDQVDHIFLWQKGSMADLGTLGMTTFCVGTIGINFNTEIVGAYYRDDWSSGAYLWRKGSLIDLGSLGGPSAFAEAIDDFTLIVGGSLLADNTTWNAFLWWNGTMFNLPVNFGGLNSVAHGINDFGQIVGESETAEMTSRGFNKFKAYLWWNGTPRPFSTLGGELTAAFAMNQLGHAVGLSETNVLEPNTGWPLSHAYLWRNGVMRDLGTLPGDDASHANQVNNKDQVVGSSGNGINMTGETGFVLSSLLGFSPDCSAFQFQNGSCFDWANAHGFLWQQGKMYNLDDLVPANSGWHFFAGDAINDLGEIVAEGIKDGDPAWRACLLRPKK